MSSQTARTHTALQEGSDTHSEHVHRQLSFKSANAPVVHVNGRHSGRSRQGSNEAAGLRVGTGADCRQALGEGLGAGRSSPLAEHSVIHQVGSPVGAAEGVVDRLVPHRERGVVGDDIVVKHVFGILTIHVLKETHYGRQ